MLRKRKEVLVGLGVAGAVVLVLAIVKAIQISAAIAQAAHQGPPPEAVTSAIVSTEEWPQTFSAVGSLEAVQGAILSAEEDGRIAAVQFESGATVSKGQVLVEIDSSVEHAQLDGVLAQLELAEVTAKRQRALRAKRANAQSDLDTAEANLRDLKAEAARLRATIQRKQIIAPFDGVTGIRQVNVGTMVQRGAAIVSLNDARTLFVNFDLPQRAAGRIEAGGRIEIKIDSYPDEVFLGKVTAVESQVRERTRTFQVQATFDNVERKLRAGMFASVLAFLPKMDSVLSIPASSVQYAPYGNTVWVIEAPDAADAPRAVRSQIVKLGRRLGDRVAVERGLVAGQEIVSSGTFKMRPGAQVFVNNVVTPGNELAPNPKDT